MKLRDFLIQNKITSEKFARMLGSSLSAVNKWRTDERLPRAKWIAKIKKLTKGQVQLEDWYS